MFIDAYFFSSAVGFILWIRHIRDCIHNSFLLAQVLMCVGCSNLACRPLPLITLPLLGEESAFFCPQLPTPGILMFSSQTLEIFMIQLIPNQDGRIIIKVGGVIEQPLTPTTFLFQLLILPLNFGVLCGILFYILLMGTCIILLLQTSISHRFPLQPLPKFGCYKEGHCTLKNLFVVLIKTVL